MANDERSTTSTTDRRWRTRVGVRVRDGATLATVTWLICVVVATAMAVASGTGGNVSCPTGAVVDAVGDPDSGYGTNPFLPTLEPVAERPTVVQIGRARAVRIARASLTVVDVSTDDFAPVENARAEPTELATDSAGGVPPPTQTLPTLDDVDAPLPLEVRVNPFVRDDGVTLANLAVDGGEGTPGDASDSASEDGAGDPRLVTVRAFSRRGIVTVELCVDRDAEPVGHPGRYAGSVTIVDPRVVPVDVPFVIALAYPNAALVALITLAAVAVAAVYSWRVHGSGGAADKSIDFHEFFGWLRTWGGLLAVSTGAVAAYVAYSATYLSNSVWGTSVTQFTAIVGAVFTAFVTAATTILGGSRLARRSRSGTGDAPDGADGTGASGSAAALDRRVTGAVGGTGTPQPTDARPADGPTANVRTMAGAPEPRRSRRRPGRWTALRQRLARALERMRS